MKKGIIVGKEQRSYTAKDGTEKVARTLHVVWDKPETQEEGAQGHKVEAVFVSKLSIDNIHVGDYCGFEYDVMPGRNGLMAVLSDIKVLGKAPFNVQYPKI